MGSMNRIFKLIEKLFILLIFFPPLYMAYRFVRWSLRQNKLESEADENIL